MASYIQADHKPSVSGGLFKRMLRKNKPTKLNPVGISSEDVFRYIDSSGVDPDTPNIVHDFQTTGNDSHTPHTAVGTSSFFVDTKDNSCENMSDNLLDRYQSRTCPSHPKNLPPSTHLPQEMSKSPPTPPK